MLLAIGVTVDGRRKVLGMQAGATESTSNWKEQFSDLKRRGLDGIMVSVGIMGGLSKLERVFKEEFPDGTVQRCQFQSDRNFLAPVPRRPKKTIRR